MVTAERSAQVAAHALAAGATRYLTKDTPALLLIDAILAAGTRPALTLSPSAVGLSEARAR
jgi:CheY-like chemotaxis protein